MSLQVMSPILRVMSQVVKSNAIISVVIVLTQLHCLLVM
jgi:hypothetical protein